MKINKEAMNMDRKFIKKAVVNGVEHGIQSLHFN